MGNKDAILERGVVCDKCNNGVLSELDNELINFMPIALARSLNSIPNKEGKYPAVKLANVHLKTKRPRYVIMDFMSKSRKDFIPQEKGFKFTAHGNKMDNDRTKILARSLCKIGLGMLHFTHGAVVSLNSRYDKIRRFIVGEENLSGSYLIRKSGIIEKIREVETFHWFFEKSTLFICTIYGIRIAFDLEMNINLRAYHNENDCIYYEFN